ncbi:MAG: ATP-dependent Clp protease ATP-binding subunit [Planctomycetes bacterium]|nr:ATP-dependent Clp protease ATP-binding subunit [Planctomycetota bacterium]
MTDRHFQLHTLIQSFENDTVLAEALHFPDVSRLAESSAKVRRAILTNARGIAERTQLLELYRRTSPQAPEVREYRVTVKPPKDLPLWREPIELRFLAAVFAYPGGACAAYLPDLQIEVVAADDDELARRVPEEILLAAKRHKALESLWSLAGTQRALSLTVETAKLKADIPAPKEVAIRKSSEPKEPSVLASVAVDLNAASLEEAFEYADHARRLAEALSEPQPQSVLLVGPSGVGKTAVFHELVRKRKDYQFPRTPFWATSGSRLVAGMSGFGMWQERCDNLRKEASRTRAILHLGNLVELMEVGKGVMIQQGIAGFLRPFIARGELLCVVECTPEQLPLIERQDPHLLGVFRKLEIPEPAPETASAILMSVAHQISSRRKTELIGLETLETLDRLHRRYATYSAFPGRPIRFLRNLLADRDKPATDAEVFEGFTRETGLPKLMLDASMPMDLPRVNEWFRQRIIGQDAAIDLVVDLLATVKSGLSRPRKPLASFLFAGPTGVGKTETSKALAEFLFNDRRRITRFDMSEYSNPVAVQRLIGGVFGEEGLLTSRMREQPFAVLLFDEFEKAHPLFFDLLLQLLGEARLTDAAGRVADFSNAVVIMTSNLGAEGFMQGGIGFDQSGSDAAEHFTKALRDFVRPELLNRIDRVVPFLPLDEQAVLSIVQRELELLRMRPGIHGTGTTLEVNEEAQRWIARRAYQPALGARPLKREIERSLLVPLAQALNTQPVVYALHAKAEVRDDELHLEVEPLTDELEKPRARSYAEPWLSKLLQRITDLRRKLQGALASATALRLRNEAYRLVRSLEMERRRRRKHPDAAPSARAVQNEHRLAKIRHVLHLFEKALEETSDLEDRLALSAMGRSRQMEPPATQETTERERDWANALRELMRLDGEGVKAVNLWVYSHHNELMFELAGAYRRWAKENEIETQVYWACAELPASDLKQLQLRSEFDAAAREGVRRHLENEDRRVNPIAADPPRAELLPPADPDAFLEDAREDTGAIVIRMTGEDVGLKMQLEAGAHRFQLTSDTDPVHVEVRTWPGDVWTAKLPIPKGMADESTLRRRYDMSQHQALDVLLDRIFAWTGNRLDDVLGRCITASFERELEKQVGQ